MKRATLLAAVFALAGTVAFARSALDSVVQSLTDQGYSNIEVKSGATTAKVEAVRGTEKVEITIDLSSGAVLKRETETVGEGDINAPDDGTDDSSDDSSDDDSDDDSGHHSGSDDSGGNSGNSGSGNSGS